MSAEEASRLLMVVGKLSVPDSQLAFEYGGVFAPHPSLRDPGHAVGYGNAITALSCIGWLSGFGLRESRA